MSATALDERDPESRSRLLLLDGIRGVAIILVVLSHGWVIWPTDFVDNHLWTRPLFRNGNFAVTVFLFAAGYLTHRGLAGQGLARARIGVAALRRVIRVAPITLVVVPVVLIVAAFDDSDTTSRETNARSFVRIVTYTWNWYLQDHLIDARWDLGHLWYLSVDMQAFLFVAAVIYFLRRRPVGMIFTFLGLFLLFTWWRMYVADIEPALTVLLRTTARIDAFVAGVLTAAVLVLMRRVRLPSTEVTVAGVLALAAWVPLMWYCSRDERYLGAGVTMFEIALAVLVGAAVLGARGLGALSIAPLLLLGRNSLPIYVWHYPVFAAVQRNTTEWDWIPRTLVALGITAALCVASHYLIERRVSRFLTHPGWQRFTHHPGDDKTDDVRHTTAGTDEAATAARRS